METQTKTIDGRTFDHKDVIHNHVTTYFSFVDRLKILFGKPVYSHSEIYTMDDEVNIVFSTTKTRVSDWFPKKNIGGMVKLSCLGLLFVCCSGSSSGNVEYEKSSDDRIILKTEFVGGGPLAHSDIFYIIAVDGHEYLAMGKGGMLHLESCKEADATK